MFVMVELLPSLLLSNFLLQIWLKQVQSWAEVPAQQHFSRWQTSGCMWCDSVLEQKSCLFDHSEYPLMTCEILVWTLVQLFQPIHLTKADTVQLEIWRIPFIRQNSWRSPAVNCEPLSNTIDSGIPNWANNCLSCWMVVMAVAVAMGKTSIHFEWASITIKNILPSMGPANTMDVVVLWEEVVDFVDSLNTVWPCSWSPDPFLATTPDLEQATSFMMYQGVLHGVQSAHFLGPVVGPLLSLTTRCIHHGKLVPDVSSNTVSVQCLQCLAILPWCNGALSTARDLHCYLCCWDGGIPQCFNHQH